MRDILPMGDRYETFRKMQVLRKHISIKRRGKVGFYIFDNFKYDNDPLDAMEIHIFSLKNFCNELGSEIFHIRIPKIDNIVFHRSQLIR